MLFQASRIFPDSKYGIAVIDATQEFSAEWLLNGNSNLTGYRYVIFDNAISANIVYDSGTVMLDESIPPINFRGQRQIFVANPVPADTLVNGTNYKASIQQFWNGTSNSITQSSPSFFLTRKMATLNIKPFDLPVTTRVFEFIGEYEQVDGTPIKWFRWQIKNEQDVMVVDTGRIYSSDIRVIYESFFTLTKYYIKLTGETQDGIELDNEWLEFDVDYQLERIENILIACQERSAVSLDWGRIVFIKGTVDNLFYSYLNHIPVFGHNSIQLWKNRITWNEVNNRPMMFPKWLNYVWSGAIEQNDYKILQIYGTDDMGSNSEISLYYLEGFLEGIICEIAIPKSELMVNVPLIFGIPKNDDYRFYFNKPARRLYTIEIDAGNEVVFDKVNNVPMSFPPGLTYAWGGRIQPGRTFTIKGLNALGQNTELYVEHTQYEEEGILGDTLPTDIIYGDYKVSIVKGKPFNSKYEWGRMVHLLPSNVLFAGDTLFPSSGRPAIWLKDDNNITFDTINGEPMKFNGDSAFVWNGAIYTEPYSDAHVDSLLFEIHGNTGILRAEYIADTVFAHDVRSYTTDWTIAIKLNAVTLCQFTGNHVTRSSFAWSLFGAVLIIEDDNASFAWTDEFYGRNVETVSYANIGFGEQNLYRLHAPQLCGYIYSPIVLSGWERDKILNDGWYMPEYDDDTNFLVKFNGEKKYKYSQTDIVLNGEIITTFGFVTDGNNPDIFAHDWNKITITPEYALLGRIMPDGTSQYSQGNYTNTGLAFGNTTSVTVHAGLHNYIWLTEDILQGAILESHMRDITWEPKLTPKTHMLCLFRDELWLAVGTLSVLINDTSVLDVNIIKATEESLSGDVIADGWWTVIITPRRAYISWFEWDIDDRENWKHKATVFGDYDMFYCDVIDGRFASAGMTEPILRMFDGGMADSKFPRTIDGGYAYTVGAFYTTAIALNGVQKCDYLWVTRELLSTDLTDICTNLNFEPKWTQRTEMLARFDEHLGAGNLFNEYDEIYGIRMYRMDRTRNKLDYVGERPLSDIRMLDYAARSRTEYQYWMWAVGNISFGQPVSSNIITPYFWNYAVLDCIEQEDGGFIVDQEFLFGINLDSGNTQHGGQTTSLANFTRYPKHIISPQNFVRGVFTALIGYITGLGAEPGGHRTPEKEILVCERYQPDFGASMLAKMERRYVDSMDMAQAIFDLSTNGNIKFYKDRIGQLRRIGLMQSISMNVADASYEQQKAMTVPWEENGSVEGVRITDRSIPFEYPEPPKPPEPEGMLVQTLWDMLIRDGYLKLPDDSVERGHLMPL